jgi:anaerobic selenocysteine-containing dehydrogenase
MKKLFWYPTLWAVVLLFGATAAAQTPESIKRKQEAVKKLEEQIKEQAKKIDDALREVGEAQKAVDEEIAESKKEGEDNPKRHGVNEELDRLRETLKNKVKAYEEAKRKREQLERDLAEAREELQEEKDEFEEKQEKALAEHLRKHPLPRDKKKLEKLKKDVDKWSNGDWKTPSGKDLKERLKKRIDEEIESLEQTYVPGTKQHTVCVQATAMMTLTEPDPLFLPTQTVQSAVTNPAVFEQLIERLGGEFFVGYPDGTLPENVQTNTQANVLPGLRVGLRLGKRFELQLGTSHYRQSWEGTFPVTVNPFNSTTGNAQVIDGTVKRNQSGLMAEADLAWFAAVRAVRPYLRAGVRADMVLDDAVNAQLAGVPLVMPQPEIPAIGYAPFGGAGIRFVLWDRLIIDTGASYGKFGGAYVPMAEVGVGLGF